MIKTFNIPAFLVVIAAVGLFFGAVSGAANIKNRSYDPADITRDGVVDAHDLSLVLSHWTDKGAPQSTSSILELKDLPDDTSGAVNDAYKLQNANASLQKTVYGIEIQ